MSVSQRSRDFLLEQEYELFRRFEFGHLPDHLQGVARPFAELAKFVVNAAPEMSFDRTEALRKLLEAKDCAVRAML